VQIEKTSDTKGDGLVGASKTDQERFDEEVTIKGKVVLEVLGGVGIFAALLMSVVALVQSGESAGTSLAATPKPAATAPAAATAASATAPAEVVDLKVAPEIKKGPEGKLHDAFTVTEFHVKVGQPLTLHVDNTDTAPHSITAPEAGVNIVIQPGTHDYTLVANKAGKFEWNCALPCDPWAMAHPGYMAGYITAS
jgi:heme/copper-type cytochrome/quinol oxidase subunit 2